MVTAAELFAVARTINTACDSFSFRGIAKRADSADPLKVAVEIEAGGRGILVGLSRGRQYACTVFSIN
jgi:hypothetical protein